MDQEPKVERESKPLVTDLLSDPDEIARREARNALRRFDAAVKIVDDALESNASFRLRPSLALTLNRLAIEGINRYPGVYWPHLIQISGSSHEPPPPEDVPRLVEDMCDYVNEHWESSPIHLAAYLMWRVNWVHPFSDGNGRTARALSYVALCVRLGYKLPGTNTIPEQISNDKFPYYDALEAADRAFTDGYTDVSDLEKLLGDKLAAQLVNVLQDATGENQQL
ncbi:MAG: Fic family protein [Alphaproteobacteria bacterium]